MITNIIKEKSSYISFVLGIISVGILLFGRPIASTFAFISVIPLISIPLGIIFGVIGEKSKRKGLATIGMTLGIIGLFLLVIFFASAS